MPGNIDCRNCRIKKLVRKDCYGSIYINETAARASGLIIIRRPGNAWISVPESKYLKCRREIELPVTE